jgi:phenylacetate-CoA ligase
MHEVLTKNVLFPLLQYTAGRKHVRRTLSQLEETQWYSRAEVEELQLAKLQSLVGYAYRNIPYYRNRFDELGLEPPDINSLEDVCKLPVLHRSDIKKNLSSMVARNYKGKLLQKSTSGSTGHPIVLYANGEKETDTLTEFLRLEKWHGIDIGAREARFMRTTSEMLQNSRTNRARKLLLNQMILPCVCISEQEFEDIYKKIDRFRPSVMFGVTSALYMFTQYVLRQKKDLSNIKPDLIIAWAAPLYPHQRELMETTYQCPVANLYGTIEVGHIASDCPEKGLHINDENLLVEVTKDGIPCRAGEQGNILVTTLNQYPMPFIRYDIDDIGVLDDAPCSCGRGLHILKELIGRSGEILTTPSGKILSPNFWCRMMLKKEVAQYIQQFKVIQRTDNSISIQIVKDDGYSDEHTSFLRGLFSTNLGDEVNINFEFVESIPPEKSGKYRLVVSELTEPGKDGAQY